MAEHLSGAKSLKCVRFFATFLTAAVSDDVVAAERKRNDVLRDSFKLVGQYMQRLKVSNVLSTDGCLTGATPQQPDRVRWRLL